MLTVVNSLQPIIDPEYLRIMQELRRLGIAPSGNKAVDSGKLAQAKAELVEKIKTKERAEANAELQVQTLDPAEEVEYSIKTELEEQRLGAMTLAELNRLYFKI